MSLVHVVLVDGILQVSSLKMRKYCISSVYAKIVVRVGFYSVIRQENVNGLAAIWLGDCTRVLHITVSQEGTCAISQHLSLATLTTILMMFL